MEADDGKPTSGGQNNESNENENNTTSNEAEATNGQVKITFLNFTLGSFWNSNLSVNLFTKWEKVSFCSVICHFC